MFNDEFEISAKFTGEYDNVFQISKVDESGLMLSVTQKFPQKASQTVNTHMDLDDVTKLIKLLNVAGEYIKEKN